MSSCSCALTSQQVGGQVGGQGADEQPVGLGGQPALLVAVRVVHAAWARPGARYAEARAGGAPARVADPRALGPVGVPEARQAVGPPAGGPGRQVGAGVSPGPAVEHGAALLAPHPVPGVTTTTTTTFLLLLLLLSVNVERSRFPSLGLSDDTWPQTLRKH